MELISKEVGKKALLLGNEAIVRGALEAGVDICAAYPGTPSSEIANNLFFISTKAPELLYFEFSTNEKVAMEVCAAAAASGKRSLTCMKHVGLNVASDVFNTLAYIGVKAGMVIVTADDPFMHSSQNEQDNRYYVKMASLPMFEPTNPQEAKDMTIAAFELSERLELPVIIRTTTRTSHVRGPVIFGELPEKQSRPGCFKRDNKRWVPVPAVARIRHKILLERFEQAALEAENTPFNMLKGSGDIGIIATGIAACYVEDAIEFLNAWDKVRFLKLGLTYPQPRRMIFEFLRKVGRVLVVEELEPFQEEIIKGIAQDAAMDVPIYGKGTKHLSRLYEIDPLEVIELIAELIGIDAPKESIPDISNMPEVPQRPPSLCAGCPHRETYTVVKEALKECNIKEEDVIFPTDIGCYTLGLLPPFNMADYLLCMGSSVGSSAGFSVATQQKIIAFIGDSTFFHSGISPLVNAVHNNHKFILVVLDNSTTAMTGHQPNPGIELMPPGYEGHTRVLIEDIVKACGVKHIRIIDPYKKQEAINTFKEIIELNELAVVISRAPCILYKRKVVGGKK